MRPVVAPSSCIPRTWVRVTGSDRKVYRVETSGAFWRDVLTNGMQIEEQWRSRGSLTPAQRAALIEIYNGAAQGLFNGLDPTFHSALAALRKSGLSVTWRNRVANAMVLTIGHRGAAQLAKVWRKGKNLGRNRSTGGKRPRSCKR